MIIFTSSYKFGSKAILRELSEVGRRVSTKETVADKRRLQQYVETQVKEGL